MAEVTPARLPSGLQEEEVRFRSPISESTWTRIAGSINFINERQFDTHVWNANGRFSLFIIQKEFDGRFAFLFNVEIIGYSFKVEDTGSSGTNTLDIHKFSTAGVDDGSILSTKASISNTAANGSQSIIRLDPAADLLLPTGHTKAVFSATTFLAGESLEAQIDAAAPSARNASIAIMYRPI